MGFARLPRAETHHREPDGHDYLDAKRHDHPCNREGEERQRGNVVAARDHARLGGEETNANAVKMSPAESQSTPKRTAVMARSTIAATSRNDEDGGV